MPNVHKNPFVGWHPPAEDSAWARAEAARRGVALKVVLDEALSEYRERVERARPAEARTTNERIRVELREARTPQTGEQS
jgi:hypothetical protein